MAVRSTVPAAGSELEDYVSGLFQSAGYFVEKGIHERDASDVLELDTIATSYEGPTPSTVLVEAKGGRWGFPDVFKVVGWMKYLGITRSGFFVKDCSLDLAAVDQRVRPLGVAMVDLGNFREPERRFRDAGFGEIRDPILPEIWRHAFGVERCLLDELRAHRRAVPSTRGPSAVLAYHELINDHVFFLKDASKRLSTLYAAYKNHPKLSLAVATELGGGVFGAASPRARNPVMAEAIFKGEHPAVQASFYVEHRARLSILKSAIDLACQTGQTTPPHLEGLPATFRAGLRGLREHPNFRRYALLWQVFLWGFGGFYLADRVEEEFSWLSAQTGIPKNEIDRGLSAFDLLFPLPEGSWITPIGRTTIRAVKMVPMPFRGVGAAQRLRRAGTRTYDEIGISSTTSRELARWHDKLVTFVS